MQALLNKKTQKTQKTFFFLRSIMNGMKCQNMKVILDGGP